jgi:two-component sensor histidine kinase
MRTLGEVVAGEIGQWETSGACIMPGPEVRLDLPQVQAIGLILHELSTNALKYGALATGRPLTVSWRREGESIVLDWQEDLDGSPAEPVKAGSGFGSRFMRMMVEGQLGGSYQRELTEHRFAMTIRFPAKPDLA